MTDQPQTDLLNYVFPGDGEMARLMRSHDWSQTLLGPVEQWPQSLRTTVSILLSSRYPMFTFWGSHLVKLYNDAYRPVLGATKHPSALGRSAPEIWDEIWDDIGPLVNQVMTKGEATWSANLPLFMYRSGYTEETYFTFSYSPIRDETGGIGGLFCACTETTEEVLSNRRLQILRELGANGMKAKTVETACELAINTLSNNPYDIPFALLYLTDGKQGQLMGTTGIDRDTDASPTSIHLGQNDVWSLTQVYETKQAMLVNDLTTRFQTLPDGIWDTPPSSAFVMPIVQPGQNASLAGVLILGISPRRAFDDSYRGFFDLVASNITTAITNAYAYEAERQRAEALAEIDRAKTIFFNNISHEFRTPLTLMLSPLEDALTSLNGKERANGKVEKNVLPSPQALKEQLQLAQRNAKRLLKLVNTLLDFSRIEAERIQAIYKPTDLAILTADLASTFRSLIERAGMTLVVECPPLPELIYIDREMWEKIVLNLLSNAFKFTLTGTIAVRLQHYQDHIELLISDTGIGIPDDEIPHLFERFHRVKGAQGRSFEGSGIGLSLVQELVKLHGGNIQVTSQVGQGTRVTVSIPTGFAHLPAEHIGTSDPSASTAMGVTPYLEEAWGWLSERKFESSILEFELANDSPIANLAETNLANTAQLSLANIQTTKPKILVVDDNADMRSYVKRLLEQHYTVETAPDGIAALTAIRCGLPDLVLTDVMMPQLDGFGLLKELRTNSNTRELPIILLSARAGEEARVEGLEAGADDYLIKPFSSRELIARVEASLKMAQIRREAALKEQALRLTTEQAQQETVATFKRLTQLLETMSDAFVELDKDWRIIYQNAAAEKINNGKPRSQALGKTHWEEWPDSVGTEVEYQYRKAVAEQVPVHFEHHYYYPPNFDVWLEIDAYPSEGGLAIFFRDITKRKQIEVELQERERLFSTLAEASPVSIFRFDAANNCVYVNDRWSNLTGRPAKTALGTGWMQCLHPDDRDRLAKEWLHWCHNPQQKGLYQNEGRCVRPDGSIVWFSIRALAEVNTNGETVGYIGVLIDITNLKQTELVLQESQQQLQRQLAEIEAIYQSAPIGLNVLDTDLRFVRINQRLAEINGLSVEAHIGRAVGEVVPALADVAETLLRPILETGEPLLNVEISGETLAQPGIQRTWLESFLPLRDGDRIIGISTVCEEITEHKRHEVERQQTEEELRRAKEELEVRVMERTIELQEINERLHQELLQREQIEQKLRQSKARYRAIVEDQTELIARFLPDSTILFVNDAYCRYFNVQRDDIVGKSYNPVIYEADRERVTQLVQSMSPDNPMLIIENRVVDGRGEVRWTQWVNRLLFDAQGNVIELQSVGRDITELKQTEQALRESEKRLQLALEASGDGIWDWNITTGEVYYSPQYFQMLGYEADELPQTFSTWEQLVHPDDMVWVKQILAEHLNNSARYEFDYRLRTKSGEWKWIADYGKVVVWDEAGNPIRMLGTHRDVTERKLMEAALRHSEEQRRLALDLTRIGFWDLHIPSGDLTWNNNHYRLLGLPPTVDKPEYRIWRNCVHPEDIDRIEQIFLNSIETHTDYEAEYRVVYPDDSIHWLLARGRSIYDENDQPLRSLGVILDITDRKHMEASLQESDRRWQSLLDNVQLVVVGLDINGDIEYANPFFLKLVGYQLEEVLGKNWFTHFLSSSHRPSVHTVFREVLEQNLHTHYQNPIATRSGDERMIAWNNTVLRDVSEQEIGIISIGEDITERYKIERMKAEFISVVSHELRTPLTSMQAALSLLSEKIIDPNSEEGEATIQIATEGTDRLVRLVNDILDLERLESGKIRLDKNLCNVNDLVDTAVAQMQEMAKQAGITLVATPCSFQAYADGDRLLQVLTNLLSNAIKFSSSESTVWLNVDLFEQNRHQGNTSTALLFTVKDQGRGIPTDNLESIFDRFHQVDASDSREKGGTGLGLAICRSIVRQHGGEIWVESTVGKGSTFYFTIPTV